LLRISEQDQPESKPEENWAITQSGHPKFIFFIMGPIFIAVHRKQDCQLLLTTLRPTSTTHPSPLHSMTPLAQSSQQFLPGYDPTPSWIRLWHHKRQADDSHETLAWGPAPLIH
jgi:hypothetical protein